MWGYFGMSKYTTVNFFKTFSYLPCVVKILDIFYKKNVINNIDR